MIIIMVITLMFMIFIAIVAAAGSDRSRLPQSHRIGVALPVYAEHPGQAKHYTNYTTRTHQHHCGYSHG